MTNTDDILARLLPLLDEDDDPYGDYNNEVPLGPLPLEPAQRATLHRAIDGGLSEHGCDDTLRAAEAWARREKVPWARLRGQLEERGGYCDCEVLLNVFRPPDQI